VLGVHDCEGIHRTRTHEIEVGAFNAVFQLSCGQSSQGALSAIRHDVARALSKSASFEELFDIDSSP
jgi:hypothetical protein